MQPHGGKSLDDAIFSSPKLQENWPMYVFGFAAPLLNYQQTYWKWNRSTIPQVFMAKLWQFKRARMFTNFNVYCLLIQRLPFEPSMFFVCSSDVHDIISRMSQRKTGSQVFLSVMGVRHLSRPLAMVFYGSHMQMYFHLKSKLQQKVNTPEEMF